MTTSDLPDDLPRYQTSQTYAWNYEHALDPVVVDVPSMAGEWTFCGRRVDSPIGMPAGPLLNGKWVLYYASLGFDVLTYKTVRSGARECFPMPNIVPVAAGQLTGAEPAVPMSESINGSWAVSFGMPSVAPDDWRRDVEWTRSRLAANKVLSVSVVGSVLPHWTIDELAADYARCAAWAVESGADVVEVNFSCPNVATCDGQLYQQADDAALVASVVKDAIKQVPLIIKVGHVRERSEAEAIVAALEPFAASLAMTNTIAAPILDADGKAMFGGQRRGICGMAIRDSSISQTRLFGDVVRERGSRLKLIGVGGASQWNDVCQYLQAGAEAVHVATAAMLDPLVAIRMRADASRV